MRTIVERLTSAVQERYRASALASYGAGLGCTCGDCPTSGPDVPIPAPRSEPAVTEERVTR